MPFGLVAFSESQDTAGNLAPVATIADQSVFRDGDDLVVPELNQVIAVWAAGATVQRARLVAPSLRALLNFEVMPLNVGIEPLSPPALVDLRPTPLVLQVGERLNAELAEGAAGAEQGTVLVWLADGTPAPVQGDIRTVRCTTVVNLVANTWTEANLVFAEDLPVGEYAVVGMRAESAGLQAARLNFRAAGMRPGCLGTDTASDLEHSMFRYGNLGVWGQFAFNLPPTVEFLSISADANPLVWLDLIKVS